VAFMCGSIPTNLNSVQLRWQLETAKGQSATRQLTCRPYILQQTSIFWPQCCGSTAHALRLDSDQNYDFEGQLRSYGPLARADLPHPTVLTPVTLKEGRAPGPPCAAAILLADPRDIERQRKTPSAACDRDIMYTLTLAQQGDGPPPAVYFWCPTGRPSHCAPRRGSPGLSPCIGIFQNARRDRSIGSALTGKKHTKHLHITQIRWYLKPIRKRHMASSGKGHVISTPIRHHAACHHAEGAHRFGAYDTFSSFGINLSPTCFRPAVCFTLFTTFHEQSTGEYP
jgi:hypothetical protein